MSTLQTFAGDHPRAFLLRAASGLCVADLAALLGTPARVVRHWDVGAAEPDAARMRDLEALAAGAGITRPVSASPTFTFVDLFAGIGGIRQAFQQAGGECVFTSEWNRFAVETYAANFGAGHRVAGDITKVDAATVPNHDVLVAGFPCQPFSLAGVSKKNSLGRAHGFADQTQGTLFFDVARILDTKRPRAFVLENVKNLKSHDRGNTMRVIMETLERDLGYTVSCRVLDGSRWVPQKRERVVIVGIRDSEAFDFDTVEMPDRGPTLGCILHDAARPASWDDHYAPGGDASCYTLTDHLWAYLRGYAAKHEAKGNGFGYGLVGPDGVTRTLSARYYKDGSEILLDRPGGNPRRLTPRECSRLMGFDAPGLPPLRIPVSDTQSWRQFGNSVVVPMFAAVASALANRLATVTTPDFAEAA